MLRAFLCPRCTVSRATRYTTHKRYYRTTKENVRMQENTEQPGDKKRLTIAQRFYKESGIKPGDARKQFAEGSLVDYKKFEKYMPIIHNFQFAWEQHERLLAENHKPSYETYRVLLKLARPSELEPFRKLLETIKEDKGFTPSWDIYRVLYKKYGYKDTKAVFDVKGPNDIAAYNTLLSMTQYEDLEKTIEVYNEVKANKLQLSAATYAIVLNICEFKRPTNVFDFAIQIYKDMLATGEIIRQAQFQSLIHIFSRSRVKNTRAMAYQILFEMERKGMTPYPATCGVAIINAKGDFPEASLNIYKIMQQNNYPIRTSAVFNLLLWASCKTKDLDTALKILMTANKDPNLEPQLESHAAAALIRLCCNIGELQVGLQIFEEFKRRKKLQPKLYVVVIDLAAKMEGKLAYVLFADACKDGMVVNSICEVIMRLSTADCDFQALHHCLKNHTEHNVVPDAPFMVQLIRSIDVLEMGEFIQSPALESIQQTRVSKYNPLPANLVEDVKSVVVAFADAIYAQRGMLIKKFQ